MNEEERGDVFKRETGYNDEDIDNLHQRITEESTRFFYDRLEKIVEATNRQNELNRSIDDNFDAALEVLGLTKEDLTPPDIENIMREFREHLNHVPEKSDIFGLPHDSWAYSDAKKRLIDAGYEHLDDIGRIFRHDSYNRVNYIAFQNGTEYMGVPKRLSPTARNYLETRSRIGINENNGYLKGFFLRTAIYPAALCIMFSSSIDQILLGSGALAGLYALMHYSPLNRIRSRNLLGRLYEEEQHAGDVIHRR
jgi:hypothetical protein